MSSDKQQAVLDAAQAQFLRYGFRRVTMGDIAGAAGMSRPALYLLFANKEAIFNGVLERYMNAALAAIEAGLEDFSTLADKLSFAVELWTVRPYELLNDTPEGRELSDCSYGFALELVEASYRRFEQVVTEILRPYVGRNGLDGPEAGALAEVFAVSLRGIKSGARDLAHLRTLVANLIAITTAALGVPAASDTSEPAPAGLS
ncbi:MAG: TetR/AcrR family transcriptional regulator [Gammaproteobacteria bacterium]